MSFKEAVIVVEQSMNGGEYLSMTDAEWVNLMKARKILAEQYIKVKHLISPA